MPADYQSATPLETMIFLRTLLPQLASSSPNGDKISKHNFEMLKTTVVNHDNLKVITIMLVVLFLSIAVFVDSGKRSVL